MSVTSSRPISRTDSVAVRSRECFKQCALIAIDKTQTPAKLHHSTPLYPTMVAAYRRFYETVNPNFPHSVNTDGQSSSHLGHKLWSYAQWQALVWCGGRLSSSGKTDRSCPTVICTGCTLEMRVVVCNRRYQTAGTVPSNYVMPDEFSFHTRITTCAGTEHRVTVGLYLHCTLSVLPLSVLPRVWQRTWPRGRHAWLQASATK
jgi:hypothetical protein